MRETGEQDAVDVLVRARLQDVDTRAERMPAGDDLAERGAPASPRRRAWTMSCRARAETVAVTCVLGGLVLAPLPSRSTTSVAIPAAFIARRKL
ncbi:hypothetical protein [Nocardia asiatica]|uniref:hypothetical protein n=1 Tax=Nocardia asiatica TaxID=209252 RepID=UPI003EE1E993